MSSSTCRRKARSIGRSCASAPRRVAIEIDPVVRLHYVEVAEPDMHDPPSDLERLQEALEREWGLTGLAIDLASLPGLQKALRQGELEGHRRRPRRHGRIIARLAGLHERPTASPSISARRRSPRISAISSAARSLASAGADEPADPLRRGSDEPGLLRHDEPGRRARADRGGARGDQRARRRGRARGRHRAATTSSK